MQATVSKKEKENMQATDTIIQILHFLRKTLFSINF